MSRGEQLGVSSLTRNQIAVPTSASSNEGRTTNGARTRVDEREDPAKSRPEHGGSGSTRASLPSSVIHELRTPLTSIHGYAQVLQRTMRDEKRSANALAVIVRETTRLSAMLAELSELAEIDAGDVVTTPIEVEVQQIVDGVVHEIGRRDVGQHEIVMQGAGLARCNPTILSQVLSHVLTNAVRYSEPDSEIQVAVRQRGRLVEILVADRGISVDPADAERIYEPYERGSNARQAGVRGLGLGLYLARSELAEIGGTIDHRARDGGGTVFRITVPAV